MAYNDFTRAFHSGDLAALSAAVAKGADPDQELQFGRRALHEAVDARDLALASALLELGANPDVQDDHGDTPLMMAAMIGDNAMLELLIQAGSNLNIRNNRGMSATTWAESEGHTNSSVRLQESGAEEPYRRSPLQTLIVQGALDNLPEEKAMATARQSLADGANIDHQDIFGATALMIAAGRGQASLVKLLLRLGANPALKDRSGASALDWARDRGNKPTIAVLGG